MQTIEQTAKRFKAYMAGGAIAMIVGVFMVASDLTGIGGILLILGLALYIAARAGAWWHHG